MHAELASISLSSHHEQITVDRVALRAPKVLGGLPSRLLSAMEVAGLVSRALDRAGMRVWPVALLAVAVGSNLDLQLCEFALQRRGEHHFWC